MGFCLNGVYKSNTSLKVVITSQYTVPSFKCFAAYCIFLGGGGGGGGGEGEGDCAKLELGCVSSLLEVFQN